MSRESTPIDTLYEYALATDEADAEAMEDCFVEEAVNEPHIPGRDEPRQRNRAEILDYIVGGRKRTPDIRRHIVSNVRTLDQDDRGATLHAYVMVASTVDGKVVLRCTGTYDVQFVRCDDRKWRIKRMVVRLDGDHRPTE